MGIISPLGHTAEETWQSLLDGRSGIGPITQFDSEHLPVHIAGEVKEFNPGDYMNFKEARRISRASQLAIAATSMALEDAGLQAPLEDAERVATIVGTGSGGLEVADRELTVLRTKGFGRVSPFAMVGYLANMPAYHLSLLAGAKGHISTVVAACASGTQAIGEALDIVRNGRADMAIAGGVEGLVHEATITGFARMRALSTRNDDPQHASRPFDRERDGTVISEGAGIVVLERLDHALARGATIHAARASSHICEPSHGAGYESQVDPGAGRVGQRQASARHLRPLPANRDDGLRGRSEWRPPAAPYGPCEKWAHHSRPRRSEYPNGCGGIARASLSGSSISWAKESCCGDC